MRSKVRAYSHQGHGPRAEQQAGYISATSDSTPSVAKGSRFSNRSPCQERRSLIAAPLSRAPSTSSARVMVLFAVSTSCRNIWCGPERGHCKVHNGLTFDHVPTGWPRNCLHPRPGATQVSVKLRVSSDGYAAVTFGAQWNGSPDRQTLCRITDSLRAKATRALPGPERRSIASAQSFRCSDRFTR